MHQNLQIFELLETLANKQPGILEAFQNKKTGDVVVIYEEPSSKLGRMIALSNAFVVENDQQDPARKPEYDEYPLMFHYCDQFNASLHNSTWPHRHGGSTLLKGEIGRLHDFAFTVILADIYVMHLCLNHIPIEIVNFYDKCLELADQLMAKSIMLEEEYIAVTLFRTIVSLSNYIFVLKKVYHLPRLNPQTRAPGKPC